MSAEPDIGGIPFPDFVVRHRDSSIDDLRGQEASGFLLVTRVKEGKKQVDSMQTLMGSGIRAPLRKTLKDMVVFPIKKTNAEAAPNMVTVGRVPKCDLVLPHGSMSRLHAYFKVADGRVTLTDAGSLNGTSVNRKRLNKNAPKELHPGDSITFGKAFGATFHTADSMFDYIANFKDYL